MGKWILIVVFLNGYGPRETMVMQEFNSKETCMHAADEALKLWKKKSDESQLNGLVCVPK